MEISLNSSELKTYIGNQLDSFFPDKYRFKGEDVDRAFCLALERLEYCYKFIVVPAYNHNGQTFFSHLHGDQYSQFLYYLSNSLWTISENKPICDKIIQLNRLLSGMFYSYKAGLPDIFYWSHPIGTVLGNAPYGNFFSCRQNCTVATQVGDNQKSFGKGLYLGAGAQILTMDIEIGDRVVVGAGTTVHHTGYLASDTLVINKGGKTEQIKRIGEAYDKFMLPIWNVKI